MVDAYTYLYARYLVLQQENYDINVEKIGYNKIKYNPLGSAQFVNPNLDVAYLEAWIAVDKDHAVILNVPKIDGRYYTAQLLDGWANVIVNINNRNFPKTPYGKFALVLKGSNPTIPADAVKIELPSEKAKILARVELKGTPDVAQKLQKQFTLTVPEGIKIAPPVSIPDFTPKKPIGGEIFDKVEEVLNSYPDVMPKGKEYQAKAIAIGEYRKKDDKAKARIDEIVETKAIPGFLAGAKGFGTQKGGWSVSYATGNFGDDILARDIINYGGLWANKIDEAIYFIGLIDSNKQPLSGDKVYEIRFPKDGLPDTVVDAFWSATVYSVPDYRVVENKLKRYNLNNVSGLKKNPDGSLSIWLASSLPKGAIESNWLPTPAGKGFSINFRTYVPKKEVQDGKWFPAPIEEKK
ncbi:acetyl-coenzyme A synthetase [Flavobacterium johnsoniae]|uniref:Acetyl-coenzyme A synthetase n=1 Tax=Flavobacterium johnsoniae TaxID=986 RepID=A0A1J7BWK2_FLAJO|nr:acetyl-coenzyme A synthetase [Flavobacterium johnsoniae]